MGVRRLRLYTRHTADFLDNVKRAYATRQNLTGRNAAIGTFHRNRLGDRTGGTNEAFTPFECPLCQRQFLTELSFRNHLVLHPGTSRTVIIRSLSNNDDPGPDRAWIWD